MYACIYKYIHIGTTHSTQSVFETSNEVFVPSDLNAFQTKYNLTHEQPTWHDNGGIISNETCYNRKYLYII